MKTFKSFVTKRSLVEKQEDTRATLFKEILTKSLSIGRLTEKSPSLYLTKTGPVEGYAAYSELLTGLEDNNFNINVEILNTVFVPYFVSTFKNEKQFSKINEKWKSIYNNAVKLNTKEPTAGYIVPDPDFATAAIKLLESTDVNSPEVQFFVPHNI